MPVSYINAATGQQMDDGRSPTYNGLGSIQAYGYGNPYGPYATLPKAPGVSSPTTVPTGSSSSTTTGSAGPTAGAESWYNGVLSGQNLPYSPFAKANLESKATDMNSAAETARNQTMNDRAGASGASANDPSLQGARMNSMARRQGDNSNAVQSIESKANQANFGAQADVAAHLFNAQIQREEMSNRTAMNYSPWSGRGGGYSTGQGNNFGGGGGFLEYQNARLGNFNARPQPSRPNSYYENMGLGDMPDSYYQDMGLQ